MHQVETDGSAAAWRGVRRLRFLHLLPTTPLYQYVSYTLRCTLLYTESSLLYNTAVVLSMILVVVVIRVYLTNLAVVLIFLERNMYYRGTAVYLSPAGCTAFISSELIMSYGDGGGVRADQGP